MHELAVIDNIMRITLQVAEENKLSRVTAVKLDVGEMQHLNEAIMQHGFEAATANTLLNKAALEIKRLPVKLKCNKCGKCFGTKDGSYNCPRCKSTDTEVKQGMELNINSIEGE